MNISDIAKIMDALTKLKPEELAGVVQQQTAPIVQMLSGISNTLDNLNANIVKLTEAIERGNKPDA